MKYNHIITNLGLNRLREGVEGSCLIFPKISDLILSLLTLVPFSVFTSTLTFLDGLGICTNFSNLTFLGVLTISGLEVQEIIPGLSVMAITPVGCLKRFDGVTGAATGWSLLQPVFGAACCSAVAHWAAPAASCTLLEGFPASSAAAKESHQGTAC